MLFFRGSYSKDFQTTDTPEYLLERLMLKLKLQYFWPCDMKK